MGQRPRDKQRAGYYRAESEVTREFATGLVSVDACQELADRVQYSTTWAELLGDRGFAEVPTTEVRDGRGRRYPCSARKGGEWTIHLPKRARTDLIVLRQLANLATPESCASHGPEFVSALIRLIDDFLPAGAGDAFRKALGTHKVDRVGSMTFRECGLARVLEPVPQPESHAIASRKTGEEDKTSKRRSGRPRDSQRSRVYKAEQAVWDRLARQFDSVEDVRKYVFWEVEHSEVWARLDQRDFALEYVTVGDGRGSSRARAFPDEWRIEVPARMRNEWVVLHELAHLLTPGTRASHGPEFVRNFLTLVEEIIGKKAASVLERSFKEHRVQVTLARRVALLAA